MEKKNFEAAIKLQGIFLSQFRDIIEWSLAGKYSNVIATEMLSWKKPITASFAANTYLAKNMKGMEMNPQNYIKKIFTDFLGANMEFNMYYEPHLRRPFVNFLLQLELRDYNFVDSFVNHCNIVWLYEKLGNAEVNVKLKFDKTLRGMALNNILNNKLSKNIIPKYRDVYVNPLQRFSEKEGKTKYFYKKPLLTDSELFEIDIEGDKAAIYLIE